MSENKGTPTASAVDQCPADATSDAGPADPSGHAAEPSVINDEDAVMPTAANVVRSVLAASGLGPPANRSHDAGPQDNTTERVAGGMVRAAGAQVAEVTHEAAEAVADTAREVKSAISGSALKAGKKLDDKAESSLGPYGSPGTCVPSDLDPLAAAVHAGLDLEEGAPDGDEDVGEGRDGTAGTDSSSGRERRE